MNTDKSDVRLASYRSEFAQVLNRAVISVLGEFRRENPDDTPYALALILGGFGNYLGFAVASEVGLCRVAAKYAAKGYRYQGWEWEEFDNLERLGTWLRWANPDDGWHYGDFSDRFEITPMLANLVQDGVFGKDAEDLEEFCTEVLAGLQSNADWLAVAGDRIVVGVTFGSDPRDFLSPDLSSASMAFGDRALVESDRRLRAEFGADGEVGKTPPPFPQPFGGRRS